MPLYTFGGTPSDVLTDASGNVIPDYPLLVKAAGTGATVTALFEADGTTPIAQLRTNVTGSATPGAVRTFKAQDVSEIEYEYLGPGGTPVRWIVPRRWTCPRSMRPSAMVCPDSNPAARVSGCQSCSGSQNVTQVLETLDILIQVVASGALATVPAGAPDRRASRSARLVTGIHRCGSMASARSARCPGVVGLSPPPGTGRPAYPMVAKVSSYENVMVILPPVTAM